MDFCTLVMCTETLLNSRTKFSSRVLKIVVASFGLPPNKDNFIFFPIFMPFIDLSCFMTLANTLM